MLVGERMTKRPITAHPDTAIDDALKLMRESKVRRLPVLDKKGKLVGIVTEKDLLYVSPSPATSLSVYELHYLISKIKVQDVMAKDVITATEYTPIEEAARIMADNKIGSLPVLRDGKVVGIITETDVFKLFLELFGAREKGVRLAMLVPEQKGILATITHEITEMGGNIISLGTFVGDDPTNRLITVKVSEAGQDELVSAMEALGMEMLDVRAI
jgi:acetoin utilization protein AcuB